MACGLFFCRLFGLRGGCKFPARTGKVSEDPRFLICQTAPSQSVLLMTLLLLWNKALACEALVQNYLSWMRLMKVFADTREAGHLAVKGPYANCEWLAGQSLSRCGVVKVACCFLLMQELAMGQSTVTTGTVSYFNVRSLRAGSPHTVSHGEP